jgi:hypothetical protein
VVVVLFNFRHGHGEPAPRAIDEGTGDTALVLEGHGRERKGETGYSDNQHGSTHKTQNPADLHVRSHPVARADRVVPKDESQGNPADVPTNRHTDGGQYTGTAQEIKQYFVSTPTAFIPAARSDHPLGTTFRLNNSLDPDACGEAPVSPEISLAPGIAKHCTAHISAISTFDFLPAAH